MQELGEGEIWKRPNQHSNSVGTLFFTYVATSGSMPFHLLAISKTFVNETKNFRLIRGYSGSELLKKLRDTIEQAKGSFKTLAKPNSYDQRKVQGYTHSGIGIIIHVTEHYSYHTGQIIFWTKLLKDKDLGFYAGINLNTKNERPHP